MVTLCWVFNLASNPSAHRSIISILPKHPFHRWIARLQCLCRRPPSNQQCHFHRPRHLPHQIACQLQGFHCHPMLTVPWPILPFSQLYHSLPWSLDWSTTHFQQWRRQKKVQCQLRLAGQSESLSHLSVNNTTMPLARKMFLLLLQSMVRARESGQQLRCVMAALHPKLSMFASFTRVHKLITQGQKM